MNTVASPITKCHVCGYDLTGLLEYPQCPECGFIYDETTLMWRQPRSSWRRYAIPVIAIVVGTSIFIRPLVAPRAILSAQTALQFTLLPAMFVLWLIWCLGRLTHFFIVLSSETVAYCRTFGRPRVYRFDGLEKTCFTPLVLHQVADRRRKRVRLPLKWMAPEEQEELYQEFARRWRAQYGQSA